MPPRAPALSSSGDASWRPTRNSIAQAEPGGGDALVCRSQGPSLTRFRSVCRFVRAASVSACAGLGGSSRRSGDGLTLFATCLLVCNFCSSGRAAGDSQEKYAICLLAFGRSSSCPSCRALRCCGCCAFLRRTPFAKPCIFVCRMDGPPPVKACASLSGAAVEALLSGRSSHRSCRADVVCFCQAATQCTHACRRASETFVGPGTHFKAGHRLQHLGVGGCDVAPSRVVSRRRGFGAARPGSLRHRVSDRGGRGHAPTGESGHGRCVGGAPPAGPTIARGRGSGCPEACAAPPRRPRPARRGRSCAGHGAREYGLPHLGVPEDADPVDCPDQVAVPVAVVAAAGAAASVAGLGGRSSSCRIIVLVVAEHGVHTGTGGRALPRLHHRQRRCGWGSRLCGGRRDSLQGAIGPAFVGER